MDWKKILTDLLGALNGPSIQAAIADISRPADQGGFDWKFWDHDEDEFKGPFEEFKHNVDLLTNVIEQVVLGIELLAENAEELAHGEHKLQAAAATIARAWQWPWYMRWAGGMKTLLVKFLVSIVVKQLNNRLGKAWGPAFLEETNGEATNG